MEVTRRKRRLEKIVIEDYLEPCHDLQLYIFKPQTIIPLAEFEELALDRLKALRIVEQSSIRDPSKTFEDRRSTILAEFKKQGLKLYAKLLSSSGSSGKEVDVKARLDDHIAHFILRIAYCRSDALRKWFMAREFELFRLRFLSLSSDGVRSFLNAYLLRYTPIPEKEKNTLKDMLITSTLNGSHAMIESTDFYKVPFVEVPELVASRKVFLSQGFAYVPNTELVSLVTGVFKRVLNLGLKAMAHELPMLEEDERIIDFLDGLHTMHTGESYTVGKDPGSIKPEDLDALSRISYPPCMRQIHESIRATNHAKHFSRMQYGLFLKAIGLSLEDSMRFWREAFSKKMDVETFEKQHAYNIRHNYGQEGRRVNYTAYSCMRVIQASVGPGDCNGCPFRHNDATNLKQMMQGYGIPIHGSQDILELSAQHHYQIACTKFFELTHNASAPDVINHPNQYFEMSQEHLTGKVSNKGSKGPHIKVEKPTGSSAGPNSTTPKANPSTPAQDEWADMDMDVSAIMAGVEQ